MLARLSKLYARLAKLYAESRKAIRGALVAVIPVVLVCVQAGASVLVTVLSSAAALLGVGGVVHQATNDTPPVTSPPTP